MTQLALERSYRGSTEMASTKRGSRHRFCLRTLKLAISRKNVTRRLVANIGSRVSAHGGFQDSARQNLK